MKLKQLGHSVDKVEFIIMGGTFMSLPEDYRDYFIRNLHDALSGQTSCNVQQVEFLLFVFFETVNKINRLAISINRQWVIQRGVTPNVSESQSKHVRITVWNVTNPTCWNTDVHVWKSAFNQY